MKITQPSGDLWKKFTPIKTKVKKLLKSQIKKETKITIAVLKAKQSQR